MERQTRLAATISGNELIVFRTILTDLETFTDCCSAKRGQSSRLRGVHPASSAGEPCVISFHVTRINIPHLQDGNVTAAADALLAYLLLNILKVRCISESPCRISTCKGMGRRFLHSHSAHFALLSLHCCLPLLFISTNAVVQASQNISFRAEGDCIPWHDWIGNGYVASDCHEAIRRFIYDEGFSMDRELEFLAPLAQPQHTLPIIQTPRRYTVGKLSLSSLPSLQGIQHYAESCSFVIDMITAFPGALPGLVPRSYYPTDTSNSPNIRDAVGKIEDRCIDDDII